MMKGKQESPGAKEGRSIISVLFFSSSCLGNVELSTYLLAIAIRKLNTIARRGKIKSDVFSSIFNKATKIVAGNAILRIKVFRPLRSCLATFFCSRRPNPIIKANSSVF